MARLKWEDNLEEIIDRLLEYHKVEDIRAILNKKARKKQRRANDFFLIGSLVYLLRFQNESKLEWAIDQVAEWKNISSKTVKNHKDKFRAHMKHELQRLKEEEPDTSILQSMDIDRFIQGYVSELADLIFDRRFSISEMRRSDCDRAYFNFLTERLGYIPF